jgi:uncharacterized protein (DUF927 family)
MEAPSPAPNHYIHTATEHKFHVAGTFKAWQTGVAAPALGNKHIVFALSAATLAPLVRFIPNSGGVIHWVGPSSIGKTTTLHAGGSLWGGTAGSSLCYAYSWDATGNALQGLAERHSDTLLCLDEIGMGDAKAIASAAYMFASGTAKSRLNRDATAKRAANFHVLVLSTGEKRFIDVVAEAGRNIMAGEVVRFLDIRIDPSTGNPILENLHGHTHARDLSEAIVAAAKTNYGHAARAYLQKLVPDRENAVATVTAAIKAFIRSECPANPEGEISRVASRFAAVGAAGELAISYGIFPWPKGTAMDAAKALFADWLKNRGGNTPRDILTALGHLKHALHTQDSKFARRIIETYPTGARDNWADVHGERLGFKTSVDGRSAYAISEDVLSVIVKRSPLPAVIAHLDKAGHLLKDGSHTKRRITVNGHRMRLLHIAADILDDDDSDDRSEQPSRQLPSASDQTDAECPF